MPLIFLSVTVLLLTTSFLPTVIARFRTADETGDHASVALFTVGGDLDRDTLSIALDEVPELTLGGTEDKKSVDLPFYVTGRAEVDVTYSVKVDFGEAPPSYLTLTLTDGTTSRTLTCDGVQSEFTFAELGGIEAFTGGAGDPDSRVDFTLSMSVTDSDLITGELHLPTAKILVTVEQVD